MKTTQTDTLPTCRKARIFPLGVAAFGFALFAGSFLVPTAVDASSERTFDKAMVEAPKKMRKDRNRQNEAKVELSARGKQLAAKYAARLVELRSAIAAQFPGISEAQQQACREALAAQKLESVKYDIAQRQFRRGYSNKVTGLKSARESVEEAPAKLARAEMYLRNALAMPDGHEDKTLAVEEAQKLVNQRKKDMEVLPKRLAKAEKAYESAMQRKAELSKELEAAAEKLQATQARCAQVLGEAGVDGVVSNDKLDGELAQAAVIADATPYWLAVYAQQGAGHEQRIERLFGNTPLMLQMLVADGAFWGKFGPALEIYEKIQEAHPRSGSGLFQRLALAVALEHAVPIVLNRPKAENDKPVEYIDPVARYHAYETAYLADELDPSFPTLSAWSLRMVVNGDEPDEISAWGRQMLRNYRPDLVAMPDQAWRYVKSVETEINYTSKYQKLGYDRDELQGYQNILAVGGICGRRAFFGRFILRAFGVPTEARSQPGHAALVRSTPDGWVCCLGAGWGAGNRTIFERYPTDLDFLASSQAREEEQAFMLVKRAIWIGTALGEDSQFGYHQNLRMRHQGEFARKSVDEIEVPEFWHASAMITQNMIIDRLGVTALEAVGEDIGESNESLLRDEIASAQIPESERAITVDASGTIHVPAAATSEPTNNTDVIRFMPSNIGGMQLHYTRFGGSDTFEYKINAPKSGKYHLTARLVTPAPKQQLFLKVNDARQLIKFDLPYTVGKWDETQPITVELKKGENVLSFHRGHYFMRGVTIRDFNLVPVK